MSPQALLLAERIVCNKTKAIGARRCNTILINAGADPSQYGQRAERTFAAAKSPAHESLCAPVLFSAALNRWLAFVRRISHLVAHLTEQRATDRPGRSLFAGRSAADGRKINDLAQCAFLSRNVRILRNHAKSKLLAHRIETADRRRHPPR
jgi:hypothetical protein